jgi:hypothetical protein
MAGRRAISFCMLNRDGAETIGECLRSVAHLVDEMIVVDTGSIDDSPEIARGLGARVIERDWPEDFSQARNSYVSLTKGRWILTLDADEFLAPWGREDLDALLERYAKAAFRFTVRTYFPTRDFGQSLSPGELVDQPLPGIGVTVSHTIRLFFNGAGVEYSYPVHESLMPSLRRAGIPVRDINVPIHHLGFITGRSGLGGKFERYLALGRRKLRDHPGHPLSYFELGKLLSCHGELEEAVELLDRCVAMAPSFPDGHYHAAMVRFRLKRYEQCRERVELGLARFPRDASLRYLRALLDIREERFSSAVETLVALAEERPGHFPTRIHIATTYLRLGRPADAAAALSEARELAPWEPSVYLIAAEIASANGESSRVEEILAEGIAVAGPVPELIEYRHVIRALERSI